MCLGSLSGDLGSDLLAVWFSLSAVSRSVQVILHTLVEPHAWGRSTVAAALAGTDTYDLAVNGARDAVLKLEVHLGNGVLGEDGSIRDVTCPLSVPRFFSCRRLAKRSQRRLYDCVCGLYRRANRVCL